MTEQRKSDIRHMSVLMLAMLDISDMEIAEAWGESDISVQSDAILFECGISA